VYVGKTPEAVTMREIVHVQVGQCGNQIGSKVRNIAVCVIIYLISLL